MTLIEQRPEYESIDWHEVEQRFRDGALRAKLMRLAATLTAIAIVLLGVNLIGLFWLRTHVQDLIDHRAPLVDAAREAQLGMQRSLAALRGWVALGDPQFKSDRQTIWEDQIMPALAEMDEQLQAEDVAASASEIAELTRSLDDLRESQWWVADVARTPGNEPARVEYETHVLPIRRNIDRSLREIGETAAQQGGTTEDAIGYLSLLALHMSSSEAALQEVITYGRSASVHNFNLSYAEAEDAIAGLLATRMPLTPHQIANALALNDELVWYGQKAQAVIDLRMSPNWNIAQNLMAQETAPLTSQLAARLDALANDQRDYMRRDSHFVTVAQNTIVILSIILIVLMAGIAFALTNRRAEQITRPVMRLSKATTQLAKGQLSENVPITTDDELGRLTVAFNHMRVNLQRSEAQLRSANERMRKELESAASYVRSLLPPRLQTSDHGIETDWTFIASAELGGDSFGYDWIDDTHLSIYLLDVCGHGVGPAMLSISAHNALRQRTLPNTDFLKPAEVLSALNQAFPMSENQGKFFTIWYGVYDTTTRELTYGCAGHHAAVMFEAGDLDHEDLGMDSFMIGVVDDAEFESASTIIQPKSRLYIFSDGLFEVRSPDHEDMLNMSGLTRQLQEVQSRNEDRLDTVLAGIRRWQGTDAFDDDYSLLELTFV